MQFHAPADDPRFANSRFVVGCQFIGGGLYRGVCRRSRRSPELVRVDQTGVFRRLTGGYEHGDVFLAHGRAAASLPSLHDALRFLNP